MNYFSNGIRWMCFVLILGTTCGCADESRNNKQDFLIRVGNRQLSAATFIKILEINKTAYSHNDLQDPAVNQDLRLRLLNQLVEELILMEKADSLGITVSDAELNGAVVQIKDDYPDGAFEEALLESAISYDDWQERLRIRLLTRKVIDSSIAMGIEITPQDIEGYLEKHKADNPLPETEVAGGNIHSMVLKRLREDKIEKAYAEWMREQRSRIPVDIDAHQWAQIMKSDG